MAPKTFHTAINVCWLLYVVYSQFFWGKLTFKLYMYTKTYTKNAGWERT